MDGDNFQKLRESIMNHKNVARSLSRAQRNLLIAHIDGTNDIAVPVFIKERTNARVGLISLKLIRPDRPRWATKTTITEDGRQVLATILADYAEALVAAGYGLSSPTITRPRAIPVDGREIELIPMVEEAEAAVS